MQRSKTVTGMVVSAVLLLALSGCLATPTQLGNGQASSSSVSGSTAGSTSQNQNANLESCQETIGTLALFEDQSLPWWHDYRRRYPRLGTTIPVIRMMVQQSNCFVIVERGRAMQAMQRERALMSSGELRDNSNFGKGQMVAADYTLSPSVGFKKSRLGKIAGATRGFLGKLPGFGRGSVGVNSNKASTTLLLLDNRSGVQVSAAVGSAKNYDFSLFGSGWNRAGWGSVQGFADTDEGKVIMSAFADSYNQMVKALRNYKPQRVAGGLGKGGKLAVDGAVKAKPQPKKAVVKRKTVKTQNTSYVVKKEKNINVSSSENLNVRVDAYDERALNNYYKALKLNVEHLSTFASFNEEQLNALKAQTKHSFFAMLWLPAYSGKMDTAKIELESWPLTARQKGWSILGKKIKKYNKLFYKYRKMILANAAYDKTTKDRLSSVELVTEKSIFAN